MHNTPLENLEFKLQFSTTNLRYLLGATPKNREAIRATEQKILSIKREIETEKNFKLFVEFFNTDATILHNENTH